MNVSSDGSCFILERDELYNINTLVLVKFSRIKRLFQDWLGSFFWDVRVNSKMMSEAKYLPILVELLLANLLWVEDETKSIGFDFTLWRSVKKLTQQGTASVWD